MKSKLVKSMLAMGLLVIAATSSAQQPSSAFDRGHSLQAFQDPALAAITSRCQTPPPVRAAPGGGAAANSVAPPGPGAAID